MARVLLADCQPLFNEALAALFDRDGEHEVVGQCSSTDVLASLGTHRPDLVLVDADLAFSERPSLVASILRDHPGVKVVVLARELELDLVVAAIHDGAAGVVGKTSGAKTVLRAVQAVLEGEGVVPRSMLPGVFRRLVERQTEKADSPISRLSPREREVLVLLGRGWDNAHIGSELFISPNTVRTHIQNILEKLEMHSKLEAAAFAMQRSLELSGSP